ncbi:conjugal transfer protein TraG N-terminal domain-containing protein [Pseudomonas cichorii]|nr:conjugal transfer protein TraG N-terminal domain-containing protein [Pseudomonas cichorii]MBX8508935.1 conjugal transfer protein TraG N-terminal domain-containing protein [Pseudomonas cichorii]MBX8524498.1 conjugal transfer protein TraG N-terminal domain-containing protein [Pseudomonas cichorii]
MTLYANDYLEYYLTLVGWIINNGLWDVMMDSGLLALPFIAIILQEWLKARAEGADEGNKGLLSTARIENRMFVASTVILFAGMPIMNLSLSTLQFDDTRARQCQVQVAQPQDTRWGATFTTLNGQSARVPIWWFVVHGMSKAVTGAAVASIPCGTDLRQMRMEVSTTRIKNPLLAQEVADFTNDCYAYSRARLFMKRPQLDEKLLNDINWIGSTYFHSQRGYYDTDYSRTPRVEWPYDPVRDAGLAQVKNGGGYPTCNQWWSDTNKGLRARLLDQIKPSLTERFVNWATFMTPQEVGDALIREISSPRAQRLTQGRVYTDYGGQVGGSMFNDMSRAAGTFGLGAGSLAYFPGMDVVRQALPMVMALLKMTLIICIPLILMLSTFELKTVVTVSIVQFALIFVDFWFQLARWLDTTILDALYGAGSPHGTLNPLLGMNNTQQDMLLNYVMGAMFIVLPMLWIGALGWAGISAGPVLDGLLQGTKGAEVAGSKGADKAWTELKKGLKD